MKFFLVLLLALSAVANGVTITDLQMRYDVSILSEELERVATAYLPRRGSWVAIPLRNATGSSLQDGVEINNSINKNGMLPCKDTDFLEQLPYMASVLDDIRQKFATEIGLVRISKVPAYQHIARHYDGPIFDLEKGSVCRLHLPIITGEDVTFEMGYTSYHLEPGVLYYTNVSKSHAVFNNGSIDRIHLIIDVHTSPELRAHILSSNELS